MSSSQVFGDRINNGVTFKKQKAILSHRGGGGGVEGGGCGGGGGGCKQFLEGSSAVATCGIRYTCDSTLTVILL